MFEVMVKVESNVCSTEANRGTIVEQQQHACVIKREPSKQKSRLYPNWSMRCAAAVGGRLLLPAGQIYDLLQTIFRYHHRSIESINHFILK